MNKITLYGFAISLYTGRARSYLIKAGLPYNEIPATSAHFFENVLPVAGPRTSYPTIETEEGDVIRDGAAIIEHYEAKNGRQFLPTTPKQKILSLLFDVIGAEGLLRPAMHYRWGYPEENQDFLKYHFECLLPDDREGGESTDDAMQRMRNACQAFGAAPDTVDVVEGLYMELLETLAAHFSASPYLFGGRPSIGDFGMIGPFFAHLGRDPKPLSLMQKKAFQLFRWVERMNRADADIGEFDCRDESYLLNDEIPITLIHLLKQLAVDFVPETEAASRCINRWLGANKDLQPETPILRGVGMCEFVLRGKTISALAQPYRFYLLKRVQDAFNTLSERHQDEVRRLLEQCEMLAVLDITIDREIVRRNNREVWL